MYELRFSQEAVDQLNRLEHSVAKRIMRKLLETKANPHRYFKRLSGSRESKLRVGDYRLLVDIDSGKLLILVIKVGHRKNIYE